MKQPIRQRVTQSILCQPSADPWVIGRVVPLRFPPQSVSFSEREPREGVGAHAPRKHRLAIARPLSVPRFALK
eukprot:6313944-Lingulodinium_polyedra.AAC.1